MAGKQAKILTRQQVRAALHRARHSRYPQRDRVMILLSVKAGLRAGEIAKLTWPMVLDADGRIGHRIELHDNAAKKRGGRSIPLHPNLRRALQQLRRQTGAGGARYPLGALTPHAAEQHCELVRPALSRARPDWLFITFGAAHLYHQRRAPGIQAGGSLRDVQQLAGHQSIEQTQAYIDGSTRAKRRLIELL
jgi:integrase